MIDTEKPEWLTEGAKVLAYSVSSGLTHSYPKVVTVKKISTESFSVDDDSEPRFSLRTLDARVGGTWGHTRRIVSITSAEAKREIQRERDNRRTAYARSAVNEWQKKCTKEARLAAIAALQAIEKDEAPKA